MKRLIVPAVSALLLVGLPADAQYPRNQSIQLARNDSGGDQNGSGPGGKQAGGHASGGPTNSGGHASGGATNGGGHAVGDVTAGRSHSFNRTVTGGSLAVGGQANGSSLSGRNGHSNRGSRTAISPSSSFGTGGSVTHTRGRATVNAPNNVGTNASGPARFTGFNRHSVTARNHYHLGAYSGPNGYSYRRWNYGEFLPSIYFVRDYWINDYYDYGLQYPPPGTEWVRYGDDALLIDIETGEILEVVYGQFD